MKPPNPIDVVEAAYDLEGDERAWPTNVAKAVRPLIDAGRGITAYISSPTVPPERWLDDAVLLGAADEDRELGRRFFQTASELARVLHATPRALPLAVGREHLWPRMPPQIRAFYSLLEEHAIHDFVAFTTVAPGPRTVVLTAAQQRARTFDPRTTRLWARVSAHVAAALRLRDRLAKHDAVLTPGGRVEHAEAEARERGALDALREAVRQQDRARGRMRREDPDGATEAWTALVSGRWSLVDRFERDGRRYVVARRNEHALSDPRALNPRERAIVHLAALGKSNKLIAYELGIGVSTVGTHLAAALRKLGARTRADLMRLLASFQGR